jgi:hypothetical protein
LNFIIKLKINKISHDLQLSTKVQIWKFLKISPTFQISSNPIMNTWSGVPPGAHEREAEHSPPLESTNWWEPLKIENACKVILQRPIRGRNRKWSKNNSNDSLPDLWKKLRELFILGTKTLHFHHNSFLSFQIKSQ